MTDMAETTTDKDEGTMVPVTIPTQLLPQVEKILTDAGYIKSPDQSGIKVQAIWWGRIVRD